MILPHTYIVLDLETANKNRDSICQIGITYIVDQTVRSIKTVNINPECSFDQYNSNLHGITERAVEGCRSFKEIYPILHRILSLGAVFHHGKFDPQAIKQSCSRYSLPDINANWRNSIDFLKHYWPNETSSYGLDELCKAHEIEFKHHNSGEDSFAAAQLLNLAVHNRQLNIPKEFKPKKIDGPFLGQTILFSGDMNKSALEEKAKSVGFEVVKSVTQKTDYLCLGATDQRTIDSGNSKSGKHKKAEQLKASGHHIMIISEAEFLNLISNERYKIKALC